MLQTKWKTPLTCYKTLCSLLTVPPAWQLVHLARGWKAAQPNHPACLKAVELENKARFNGLQEASSVSLVLAPQSSQQPHIPGLTAALVLCWHRRAGWGLRGCPPPAGSRCVTSQHTFPWVQHQAQALPEHESLLTPQALPITKKVPWHSLGSGRNDGFGNWELQIVPLKPVGMLNVYKIRAVCLCKMGSWRPEHALLFNCSLGRPVRFSMHKQGQDLAPG